MNNIRIAEQFTLPSKGKLYLEDVNPEVVLSSMKAKHEMLRLSATEESHKIMAQIIDDCIETDFGISSYDLCLGDFQFLLFKLRIVTFGNNYELLGKCPFCGFEQTYKIDLDSLETKEYTNSYEELKHLTLPVGGEELLLTYQTPRMLDRINTKMREYRKRHRDSDENPTILYNIMSVIDEVNGEIPDAIELEEWIKELPLADATAIVNRIDEMNNSIGVNLFVEDSCRICGTSFIVPFRVNNTFFRPNS